MSTSQPPGRQRRTTNPLAALLLCAASLHPPGPAAARILVQASRGEITLPTYGWAAVRHPYFRGTDQVNIYPYPMLDFLSREPTNRTYRTVVLENEYLRVTFLPELGGKIHEVVDKTTGQPRESAAGNAQGNPAGNLSRGRPMFYVNHVVKPGLIGQCGAWTSGGVEWNTGPQGHTVSCLQPVDVVILPPAKDGSRSVAVGETERIYGTKWTVVVTVRPGRSFLEERIRIYNPTETVRPYYFWNCTASPNTPGFRFIYPMTLGLDHSGEKFFQWPLDHGKDLTRGANYQDASSIFAYQCDQDFFGSYNDDLGRGVVSCANHHQLPGKKAWTWGWGSYGTMHQMDLTDHDGPYNEVQTGPLLTQGEVGRLDPCEAVEWNEWWYPIHGTAGFKFANRDVAVNVAEFQFRRVYLRLLATGTWAPVEVEVWKDGHVVGRDRCELSPRRVAELEIPVTATREPFDIMLRAGGRELAHFRVPLNLPKREPPAPKPKPETASEFARAGWQEFLFARFPEAESRFRKALEKDTKSVEAHTGLAFAQLDRDPAGARRDAGAALTTDPGCGLAQFALAAASCGDDESAALDHAWEAALDPATAVAGRALAAKILLRRRQWDDAVAALSAPGPWESDPVCRDRRAFAEFRRGDRLAAQQLARASLEVDPLDAFALSICWLAKAPDESRRLQELVGGHAEAVLDLAARFLELDQRDVALRVIQDFYLQPVPPEARDPMVRYWAEFLNRSASGATGSRAVRKEAGTRPVTAVLPHRVESLAVLRDAVARNPNDGNAALCLGDLLFALGRHAEGRALWQRAAALGAQPVLAYRALGMASLTLDHDPATARKCLTQAHAADRGDAIVARDLARVLFMLADRADSDASRRQLTTEARDVLTAAFAAGRGRSDFVALLARAQDRLGEFAAMARMLDSVRVTIWEGAHEAHDLFVEAHLALGQAALDAGRAADALAEFNRALEYPKNLATGRPENTREAHIHYLRGRALAALGRKTDAVAAWRKAADEPASDDARIEAARQQAKEALQQAGPP